MRESGCLFGVCEIKSMISRASSRGEPSSCSKWRCLYGRGLSDDDDDACLVCCERQAVEPQPNERGLPLLPVFHRLDCGRPSWHQLDRCDLTTTSFFSRLPNRPRPLSLSARAHTHTRNGNKQTRQLTWQIYVLGRQTNVVAAVCSFPVNGTPVGGASSSGEWINLCIVIARDERKWPSDGHVVCTRAHSQRSAAQSRLFLHTDDDLSPIGIESFTATECIKRGRKNPNASKETTHARTHTDTHTDTHTQRERPLQPRNRSSSSSSSDGGGGGLFIPRERQTQDSPQTLTGHAASCRLSTSGG